MLYILIIAVKLILFSIFSVNFISLPQEVRGIFVIKAAVEIQNNYHFVTNGEHLYVFYR